MGRDTTPELDAALGALNRRALTEELYPDDLTPLSWTELEFLVGQEADNPHADAKYERLNRNARRARVQLEHRRALDLQDRQLVSSRRTALIAALVAGAFALVGALLGWALGRGSEPSQPPPVTVIIETPTTTAP